MTGGKGGTADAETLVARCARVHDGAGQAVDWVRDVRRNAPRLDRDGDALTEKLRRARNLCRRLGATAARQVSVGVFGMSQAGKSYLISTLARSRAGLLETELDGTRFNFIGHINPPGGGKEATGLVTRFTRQPGSAPRGYPIELTLFSEADIVKILGNTFFNDFDRERVSIAADTEIIRQHLMPLQKLRQPNPTGGLDEDDMIDVFDYFETRFAKSMEPLKAHFWPVAMDLAPRLPGSARGQLLSVLWGGIDGLTAIYGLLQGAIERLRRAPRVYVPLEALVVFKQGKPEWNPESIINVDVLNRFGRDEVQPLEVLPVAADGAVGEPVTVPRSLLAVLTAEMKFALADEPVAGLLKGVDLLDFPGYRGRLAIGSLEEVHREIEGENVNPAAQLLLRGKVAYLFERYTEDQEMNVLIMCAKCDSQIEITALAPVLTAWVHATQGLTPDERARRLPGLLWVLTQLDLRLKAKPGLSPSQELQEWNNMVHITLLERFRQCGWLQEWAAGRPFDNLFLVRKPGLFSSVTTDESHGEIGFAPGEPDRLARQKGLFLEAENVARYIRDPGAAWDAVLKLNDGGMERLAAYLAQVALPEVKLARIDEQITRLTDELVAHRLGPYFFAEGAGEVERKKRLAARVSQTISDRADSFGTLLGALQPSPEQMRRLYLRPDPAGDGAGEPIADSPAGSRRAALVRLPTLSRASQQGAPPPALSGRAPTFARAVMSEWIRQLRALPESADMRRHLALPEDVLQAVTDELVTAADRARVEERLVEVLRPLEEKRSTTRIGIVDQQVLLARTVIDDFIDWLGYADVPLADRPYSPLDGRRLFEPPPPIPADALPSLAHQEFPYTGTYIVEWLEAFRELAIGNAGHSAGREINPEQNQRLGEILALVQGAGVGARA